MSQAIFKTLLDTTGYNTYLHYVPQNIALPALSFIRITPVFERELSGGKTKQYTVWRVSCLANDMAELEQLENSLKLLDNTSNADYQRIHVLPTLDSPIDSESTFFSTVVDIRTYT